LSRIFLFALTAALNPTLLTATTVMLLLPNPKRLLLGYLAGAYTTGIVVGVAIVEWLHRSGVVTSTKHSVAPGIDLALGVIALIAAYVVWSGSLARRRRERRERKHADRPKKPPRWQEALSGGTARTTFLIGLLLSFPGASYLAALTAIDKQNFGIAGDLLVVIAVNIVMLALLEVPLIAFAVAPESTPIAIDRFRGWMARHGSEAIAIGLSVIGSALILRGVLTVAG
jgi:small-conductance mechanosensitive channel